MVTPGLPQDLDEESLRRIARSFYVVRMVRYVLLVVALAGFLAASLATDAPGYVTAALGAALLGLLVAVGATHKRFLSSQRPPSTGP